LINLQKLIEINRLIFVVNMKDQESCRISTTGWCYLLQTKASAVHKLCSQSSQSADC